jgi:hypothetical protein
MAPTPVAPPAPAVQDAIRVAFNETNQAANECKAKRLSGELPTHLASVKCSNPRTIRACDAAHYKYMDLIEFFAAKRLELAEKIDRNELTEDQADAEGKKVYAGIVEAERRRDSGIRQ